MTTQQLLNLLRTLSALESFCLAHGKQLPEPLAGDIDGSVVAIQTEILGRTKDAT